MKFSEIVNAVSQLVMEGREDEIEEVLREEFAKRGKQFPPPEHPQLVADLLAVRRGSLH